MPYIKPEDYARASTFPGVPGELNYAITEKMIARLRGNLTFIAFHRHLRALVINYFDRVGMSYTNGNAVMGVLDCAAREMKRRTGRAYNPNYKGADIERIVHQLDLERKWVYDELIAPYEDVKIAENGDVYPAKFLSGG